MGRITLVIGATGLVGGQVTEELLKRPEMDEVRVLVRRPPEATHPSLRSIPVNWDELERFDERLRLATVRIPHDTELRQQ